MVRPREFDETEVLNAAIQQFWLCGYEATSVRDLAQSMQLTNASLYNAFSDKRSLFLRSLKHYVEQGTAARLARLDALPPETALRAFFDDIVERSLNDTEHKGCFMVNSALGMAPHDKECQQFITAGFKHIEQFFLRTIEAGQRAGTISCTQTADKLASLLLTVLLGLRVLARSRPERELMEAAIAPVFVLLSP